MVVATLYGVFRRIKSQSRGASVSPITTLLCHSLACVMLIWYCMYRRYCLLEKLEDKSFVSYCELLGKYLGSPLGSIEAQLHQIIPG